MASQIPSAPPRLVKVPTTQTRYMEMLLHLDQIPRSHNILVATCTWILLAGFLVVPSTFTSFKNSAAFKNADDDDSNTVAHAIVHSIANIGLLWVSGACCIVGGLGCLFMWFRWRHNYVWLLNRIFLPVTLNAAAGLLTTVLNVYTAQKGVWSRSAKIAGSVTGGCLGVAGTVFVLYNFWALEKVRDLHEREFDPEGWERKQNKKKREGMIDKVRRKLHEKPFDRDFPKSITLRRGKKDGVHPINLNFSIYPQAHPIGILTATASASMSSLTSKNASAKVRRARRRRRRVNPRRFTSANLTPTSPLAVRRRAGRQLNRDQASFNLDKCFNICQDQGFHRDADMGIGKNHFAILDPEASAPSSPCLSSADQACSISAIDASRGRLLHPTPSTARAVDVQSWIDPDRHSTTQHPSALCVPSISSSAAASARVKLPSSLRSCPKEERQEEVQLGSYNYFDGIRIPSPLLYHRRSREQLLTQSSDAGVRDEIEKSFLLTYGREQPSPDFESYKVVDLELKSGELETASSIDNAEAKPTVDRALKQRGGLAFYNIPRPPWLAQSCQLIGQRFSTPPEILHQHASARPACSSAPPILTTTNIFSIRQLGIPCNGILAHNLNVGQDGNLFSTGRDSVPPVSDVTTSPSCFVDYSQQWRPERKTGTEFIDDDPEEVSRRWQAFENAVCNLTRKPCFSEETVIARPSRTLQQRQCFDFTGNPARECMALVPARLYRQQYIGWPLTSVHSYHAVQPKPDEDGDMDMVCKAAEWISELGSGARQAKERAADGGKSRESSVFGLEQIFDADSGRSEAPIPRHHHAAGSPAAVATSASTESESFDEGYCTGESMVNIDWAETSASNDDDEWEQWD
ncbi:hypothetical protein DV736_g444, partial [Chaetothyriales sp. CBS 134916]